jgi:hypothetical protein
MTRLAAVLFGLLFLSGLIALGTVIYSELAPVPSPSPPAATVNPESLLGVPTARAAIGFRSEEIWLQQFRKHGLAFGDINAGEYLRMARVLRDRPLGPEIIEHVRRDGITARYDKSGGSFIAFDPNGTIRTFLKPADGESYFRRHKDREPNLE